MNIDSDIIDNEIGCAAGEVLINTNGIIEECKSLQDADIHSIYGYKCNIEDSSMRNELTDEIQVGQFIKNADGCKFSHCTAGYMRVGNKCEKEMILFGDTEEYIRPQYLEPEIDLQTDVDQQKESNWELILVIIFAVIIAILIVALIIVSVCCSLRKVRIQTQEKEIELQPQDKKQQKVSNHLDEQEQKEPQTSDEQNSLDEQDQLEPQTSDEQNSIDEQDQQMQQLDKLQESPVIDQHINEDDDNEDRV
ncbi:MAG: hypothetical protein EZS28_020406 [Streblomastix strix]|uniref:Uncharacterized protein n=1 Tax=Streblomastix strix TaxID=222440 RepID=A0A5J4VN32_9EUKA|nr:MAG: hypothetical protein EZS28_020406 [Streblomastix strix]